MSIGELLVLLIVAFICGALGQSLGGYSRGGCLLTIVMGFIGALVGTWLARLLGLPEIFALNIGGNSFPVIWSIIGGALFSAILGMIHRQRNIAA